MSLFFRKSQKKTVPVIVRDMKLTAVPPHQTKIFVKAKQHGNEFTSKSIPIEKNMAIWADPIKIDCEVNLDALKRNGTPLRLSFRFEDNTGSGFIRYGIAEIDVSKMYLENQTHVHILLSNCTYNSHFDANIEFQTGGRNSLSNDVTDNMDLPIYSDTSDVSSAISVTSVTTITTATGGTSVRFDSLENPLYHSCPVKIPLEQFNELEKEIDGLLADVINNSE